MTKGLSKDSLSRILGGFYNANDGPLTRRLTTPCDDFIGISRYHRCRIRTSIATLSIYQHVLLPVARTRLPSMLLLVVGVVRVGGHAGT